MTWQPDNVNMCTRLAQHFLTTLVPAGWVVLDLDSHVFIHIREGGERTPDFEVRIKAPGPVSLYAVLRLTPAITEKIWTDPAWFARSFAHLAEQATRGEP